MMYPSLVRPLKIDKNEIIHSLLSKVDAFLLDCDGVVWSGSRAIPGAKECYYYLKSKVNEFVCVIPCAASPLLQLYVKDKDVYFLTNNSTKSRRAYVEKLAYFGIKTEQKYIISASYLAANYIKKFINPKEGQYVYTIGMEGIREELDLVGIKNLGCDEKDNLDDIADLNTLAPDPNVCAVLVGLDIKMNYMKFAKAHLYLSIYPDLPYICTNDDPTLPSTKYAFPGAGALVAMLNTSLKTRTPILVGKPSKYAYETLKECFNLNSDRTCMVGDRLTTDIKFALNNGLQSVLTLSGATSKNDLDTSNIIPTFYADSLANLVPIA